MRRGWSATAVIGRIAVAVASLVAATAAPAAPHMERLTLVVPGAAGGGWDLTAKAMQASLLERRLVDHVNIVRYPGTGGLVGLSEFVERDRGRDDMLIVGGLAMLGAAISDEAAISIRDVSPIARLAGDWGVIAVKADSPIHSVADLRTAMRQHAADLRWTGGSLGGPDQALVWSIANALGAPLDDVLYYGKVGGRRATEALLGGRADIAVSGYAEFAPYLHDGRLRLIATSAARRMGGSAVPTLRENGIDASIMNWRGVFAPPGLSAAQQDRLAAVVDAMRQSPQWRAALASAWWSDAYLDARAFSQFIDRETTRWPDMIDPPARGGAFDAIGDGAATSWRRVALVLTALIVVALTVLARRQRPAAPVEPVVAEPMPVADEPAGRDSRFVQSGIEDDFGAWRLSDAERDIAWFMLRGLPMREIAGLRGTSERTVRQQAQAIYHKAGLESRSDLAGRVLERFI